MTPESVAGAMPHPAGGGVYRIAFSGGVDSSVLLDLMVCMPSVNNARLHAIHIDHGLHARSGEWAGTCVEICRQYGVRCSVRCVEVEAGTPDGPEAAARKARYHGLGEFIQPGDVLVTAHHGGDQAETVLLRMMRGAGLRGLAAMPAATVFGPGTLGRPLLDWDRADLLVYARERRLRWLEDPSNSDESLDRNYLRRRVLPALEQRWPAAGRLLARSAAHAAEGCELAGDLAALDLAACGTRTASVLDLNAFADLSAARRRNLLNHWLRQLALAPLDRRRLREAACVMIRARRDATPCVTWPGGELRRYRHLIHAMRALPPAPRDWQRPWSMNQALDLPPGCGRLRATVAYGSGGGHAPMTAPLQVSFRQGGERLRLPGSAHRKTLKKLWQEAGVPPWVRERTPLLFCEGELVAVADLWSDAEWLASHPKTGMRIIWDRPLEMSAFRAPSRPGRRLSAACREFLSDRGFQREKR